MTTESWKAVQKSFIFNILVYIKKYYAVAGCGEVEVCFYSLVLQQKELSHCKHFKNLPTSNKLFR